MDQQRIKGTVLLFVAAIFLVIFFFTFGDIKSFFSIIIVLVCGGLGVLYSVGSGKRKPKRKIR